MARTKVAARGMCSSPLSSADEEDAPSSGFPEMSPSPPPKAARRKPKPAVQKQRKALAKEPTKRKLKAQSQSSSRPTKTQKQVRMTDTAWKSAKELVREAPQEFVEYLAGQLDATQQAKFAAEFGGGQGFIVKLPPSTWQSKSAREKFATWVQALGFSFGGTLSRNVLRVASLKADVILSELHRRVLPGVVYVLHTIAELLEKGSCPNYRFAVLFYPYREGDEEVATPLVAEATKENSGASEPVSDSNGIAKQEKDMATEGYANDPAMLRLKEYFQKLDSQKIEVLSYSENHRLLSSARHMEIADAMEDVLAQPSVRRDRRLARRLSQLGRISGRRMSAIPLLPASILPPLEDDWVWDAELEKMSLTPVKRPRATLGEERSAAKNDVLGEGVLHLVLHSGLVDTQTLKEALRQVSTMWKKIAVGAYAWAIADYSKYVVLLLLSDATENGVCPNFLRIYDIFLTHEQPRQDRWGSKQFRKPVELLTDKRLSVDPAALIQQHDQLTSRGGEEGLFQYIRMEFCDGGDLEDFISLQKDKLLPLESVAVPFFFQMVFSLYCAREKFNLRHCDIKATNSIELCVRVSVQLLNFFLKDIGRAGSNKEEGADCVLHYLLEDACFELRMPASFSYWVKLADYGSADSNPENLDKPVTIDQFTTLENSPIEFLLEGDSARQSYAADTFSLGLCLLHLFSGSAPYEEILEDVRCPAALVKDLKAIWMVSVRFYDSTLHFCWLASMASRIFVRYQSPRKNSGFSVLKSVARGDDEHTLYHTLYRYLVLFGLPDRNPSEEKGIDKVWQVLLKHLRPEDAAASQPQRSSRRAAAAAANAQAKPAKEEYEHDQSLYSLASGSNPIIRRCRKGLEAISGASEMLKKLIDFNPSQRPTLKQVMYHPMFSVLQASTAEGRGPADYVIRYYKSTNAGEPSPPDV
ncbi:hypothetical protein BBJ28_00011613 [Nothophytophthora sp. Chile5]|nr:hypothetical protein BBJ28_00011613 [Nothophytophthora sp. Chile5]